MSERWRIKKGDKVMVMAGKDKGKIGDISKVLRDDRKVVVSGINILVKHKKPSMSGPGGIEKKEHPIHASNVMLVDSDNIPTRVKMEFVDGKKVRISKRSKNVI